MVIIFSSRFVAVRCVSLRFRSAFKLCAYLNVDVLYFHPWDWHLNEIDIFVPPSLSFSPPLFILLRLVLFVNKLQEMCTQNSFFFCSEHSSKSKLLPCFDCVSADYGHQLCVFECIYPSSSSSSFCSILWVASANKNGFAYAKLTFPQQYWRQCFSYDWIS